MQSKILSTPFSTPFPTGYPSISPTTSFYIPHMSTLLPTHAPRKLSALFTKCQPQNFMYTMIRRHREDYVRRDDSLLRDWETSGSLLFLSLLLASLHWPNLFSLVISVEEVDGLREINWCDTFRVKRVDKVISLSMNDVFVDQNFWRQNIWEDL